MREVFLAEPHMIWIAVVVCIDEADLEEFHKMSVGEVKLDVLHDVHASVAELLRIQRHEFLEIKETCESSAQIAEDTCRLGVDL
jgi:hypothetical protein